MEPEIEKGGSDVFCLSDREVAVVERAAQGALDKEIAQELAVQLLALGRCWDQIRLKLRVQSRAEAVAAYIRAQAHRIAEVNEQLQHEVDELRLAFERLSTTADLQGDVLDHVGEGVAIADRAGLVTFNNARFAAMMDMRPADVLGRSLFDLLGPGEGNALRRKLERCVPAEHEVRFVLPDGRSRLLKFSVTASADSEGEFRSMVVAVSDVTHRKRLETALQKALAQSEERRRHLEAVLDILPIGVALYALGGEVVRANRHMRELWGHKIARLPTTDEIATMDCRLSATGALLTGREWITRRVLAGEEPAANMDVTLATPDGGRKRLLSSAAAMHGEDGTVTGAIVASVDVTAAFSGEAAGGEDGSVVDAHIARLVEIVESLGGARAGDRAVKEFADPCGDASQA